MKRRDLVKLAGTGAFLTAAPGIMEAVFGRSAFATDFISNLQSLEVARGALRIAPQWTLLENGNFALWLWARPGVSQLRLCAESDTDAQALAALGALRDAPLHLNKLGITVLEVTAAQFTAARDAGGSTLRFVVRGDTGGNDDDVAATAATMSLRDPAWLDSQSDTVSFLLGSCIHPGRKERVGVLASMARTRADFTLFLGDTTYYGAGDWNSRSAMARQWHANRGVKGFEAMGSDRPVLCIWDDHDFGPNDATGDFSRKELTRETFLSHFPRSAALASQQRDGIYASHKIGTTRFLLLDDRTYRDATPWITPFGGDFLGPMQLEWFKAEVLKRDYDRLVVACGSQIFANNPFKETYRRHGREFGEFTAFLSDALTVPVIFVTGDVHLTEVTDLTQRFRHGGWEVTCSGVGNTPLGTLAIFKRKNRARYLYEQGFSYGRIRMEGDTVSFDHFGRDGIALASFRLF